MSESLAEWPLRRRPHGPRRAPSIRNSWGEGAPVNANGLFFCRGQRKLTSTEIKIAAGDQDLGRSSPLDNRPILC